MNAKTYNLLSREARSTFIPITEWMADCAIVYISISMNRQICRSNCFAMFVYCGLETVDFSLIIQGHTLPKKFSNTSVTWPMSNKYLFQWPQHRKITSIFLKFGTINIRCMSNVKLMEIGKRYGSNSLCNLLCNVNIFYQNRCRSSNYISELVLNVLGTRKPVIRVL